MASSGMFPYFNGLCLSGTLFQPLRAPCVSSVAAWQIVPLDLVAKIDETAAFLLQAQRRQRFGSLPRVRSLQGQTFKTKKEEGTWTRLVGGTYRPNRSRGSNLCATWGMLRRSPRCTQKWGELDWSCWACLLLPTFGSLDAKFLPARETGICRSKSQSSLPACCAGHLLLVELLILKRSGRGGGAFSAGPPDNAAMRGPHSRTGRAGS